MVVNENGHVPGRAERGTGGGGPTGSGCRGDQGMSGAQLWQRYRRYLSGVPAIGLTLDVSRMGFADGALDHLDLAMVNAFRDMDALEKGAIANPDENRM